jgi:hypothetical protein
VQLQPFDPESQGDRGVAQRVLRELVHARPRIPHADSLHAQFTGWLERANNRVVRTMRAHPPDLIDTDRGRHRQ